MNMGSKGNLSKSGHFAKTGISFNHILYFDYPSTFLQVLHIDYVLSRIEKIKIVAQNCAEQNDFCILYPK